MTIKHRITYTVDMESDEFDVPIEFVYERDLTDEYADMRGPEMISGLDVDAEMMSHFIKEWIVQMGRGWMLSEAEWHRNPKEDFTTEMNTDEIVIRKGSWDE